MEKENEALGERKEVMKPTDDIRSTCTIILLSPQYGQSPVLIL